MFGPPSPLHIARPVPRWFIPLALILGLSFGVGLVCAVVRSADESQLHSHTNRIPLQLVADKPVEEILRRTEAAKKRLEEAKKLLEAKRAEKEKKADEPKKEEEPKKAEETKTAKEDEKESSSTAAKPALPNEAERTAAMTKVTQTFGQNIASATKPEEKTAVARAMLDLVASEKNLAIRYALLVQARQVAISATDLQTSFAAAEGLAENFNVDARDAVASTIRALKDRPLPPPERQALVDKTLEVAEAYVRTEHWDQADGLAAVAVGLADTLRDVAKKKEVKEYRDRTSSMKSAHDLVAAAIKTLETQPLDRDANLVVGKYYCFRLDNWPKGLTYLAIASDAALAGAAGKELKTDKKPAEERLAAMDEWYALLDKFKGAEKFALQRHVLAGYETLSTDLGGLDQARCTTRANEIRAELEKAGGRAAGASVRQPKFTPGAIVRLFVNTTNTRGIPTPFVGTITSRSDVYDLRMTDAFREKGGSYSSYYYVVGGVVVVPSDMTIEMVVTGGKGQVGTLAVNPADSFSPLRMALPLKKGSYPVVLQGVYSSPPEFSFRDARGNNLIFYSDINLEAELAKTATIPTFNNMQQSKGILLRPNNN